MSGTRFISNPNLPHERLNFDLSEIATQLEIFVRDAARQLISFHQVSASMSFPDGFSLYIGAAGVFMSLRALQRCGFVDDGAFELSPACFDKPTLTSFKRIGFASDDLSFAMIRCLLTNVPFDISPDCYLRSKSVPDELLYGRSGLACMLQYFQSHGMPVVDKDIQKEVLNCIDMSKFPWSWHDKEYCGAAHGTSGILLTLKRIGGVDTTDLTERLVAVAALPSGNFKSSVDSTSDTLIQWYKHRLWYFSLSIISKYFNYFTYSKVPWSSRICPITTR